MSIQPSQRPSNNHKEQDIVKIITEFTRQLSLQPTFETQLIFIKDNFEMNFSCSFICWLTGPYSDLIREELIPKKQVLVEQHTDLMQQSYESKGLYPPVPTDSQDGELVSTVASPLILKDEVIGIIQLERIDNSYFSPPDYELIDAFSLSASLALSAKLDNKIFTDKQNAFNLLTTITNINKSISSNLDLDNLLNSVVSMIHQHFNFLNVGIYTVERDDKKVLSQISISDQGLQKKTRIFSEGEEDPIDYVMENKVPFVLNDVHKERQNSFPASYNDVRSLLILPLLSGNTFIGALELCSHDLFTFAADKPDIFKILADNIAIAIRNAKLYHLEQIRAQLAGHLNSAIGSLSADTSPDDVYDQLLIEIEKYLPFDAAALWLYDHKTTSSGLSQFTSSLKLAALNITDQDQINEDLPQQFSLSAVRDHLIKEETGSNLSSNFPWLSDILDSRQAIIREPGSLLEPLGRALSFTEPYSSIGVRLTINDQPIGLIVFVHRLPDQYSSESLVIGSTFANQASVAIENTRLFSLIHDQVWMTSVQLQAAETYQSMGTMSLMLEAVSEMLLDITGAGGCTIYLFDQSINAFFPQISLGFNEDQQARLNAWDVFSNSVAAFDLLIETKVPVVLTSETLGDELISLIFPTYDPKSNLLILFPVIYQADFLGAILIDFCGTKLVTDTSQNVWDDMYSVVQGIIHQSAQAIENLQVIKSREEEAYISVALLQVAQAIVSFNRLDEILSSIVRITPILVGVKRCIIYLWDKEKSVFYPANYFGFAKNEIQFDGQGIRANEFPLLEVIYNKNQIAYYQLMTDNTPESWSEIESEDVHVIEGVTQETDESFRNKLDSISLRAKSRLLIGIPLSIKGEILGVMLVEEEEPPKGIPSVHIREKRIEIVNGITQQAALAIKNDHLQKEVVNSERIEKELQLAREIQRTFLPDHIPALPGWDLDARWQPARQVGGDFYDFLYLDENRLGLVIADVADKGMPAALFMTLIRTLIRAAARENISPSAVLSQVNELLIQDAKNGMFVTVFYAILDFQSGILTYANAGHNPPILKYQKSFELVELTRTGMALGIFTGIEISEREVKLNPGDYMLLYTDGVTEAFSITEEMFSTQRLYNLIQKYNCQSSKELLDLIESAVQDFIKGTDLSDDLTLVSLFRNNRSIPST